MKGEMAACDSPGAQSPHGTFLGIWCHLTWPWAVIVLHGCELAASGGSFSLCPLPGFLLLPPDPATGLGKAPGDLTTLPDPPVLLIRGGVLQRVS